MKNAANNTKMTRTELAMIETRDLLKGEMGLNHSEATQLAAIGALAALQTAEETGCRSEINREELSALLADCLEGA